MHIPVDLDAQAAALSRGERQTAGEVRELVEGVLGGTVPLDAFGRWLVALAEAGESAAEIAGVAAALRERMLPLDHGLPAGTRVADTCGTGGDGSGSFNISTAAAIVVAAAGQPVAKHGNRAVSSRTGSADVLAALGVRTDAPVAAVARCLREAGLCFCLAPAHHPAMARVGPLRRSLGRPTVFNLVGPLCNPAGAAACSCSWPVPAVKTRNPTKIVGIKMIPAVRVRDSLSFILSLFFIFHGFPVLMGIIQNVGLLPVSYPVFHQKDLESAQGRRADHAAQTGIYDHFFADEAGEGVNFLAGPGIATVNEHIAAQQADSGPGGVDDGVLLGMNRSA